MALRQGLRVEQIPQTRMHEGLGQGRGRGVWYKQWQCQHCPHQRWRSLPGDCLVRAVRRAVAQSGVWGIRVPRPHSSAGWGQLHAGGPRGKGHLASEAQHRLRRILFVGGEDPPAGDVEGPLRESGLACLKEPWQGAGSWLCRGGKVSGGARWEPPPLLPADTSRHQALVSLRTMLAVTKKKQEKAQSSTKPTQKVWRKGDLCLLTVP